MIDDNYKNDDEINLLDIYEFLKDSWKIITGTAILGGSLGVGAAYILPEMFIASASIQSAKVLGNEIENATTLAEKMRSPTYYSVQTIEVCDATSTSNPQQKIATDIKPTVGKNSTFVAISYKSSSKKISIACLNSVLQDVQKNQNDIAQRQIQLAMAGLNKDKEKLKQAESLVTKLSEKTLTFDFKDTQFSASQLLFATLQSRQSEVTELKNNILQTELLLTEPQTKAAAFITPIYSPENKIEPKRGLIVTISLLAGGLIGLLGLALQRAIRKIKNESQTNMLRNEN